MAVFLRTYQVTSWTILSGGADRQLSIPEPLLVQTAYLGMIALASALVLARQRWIYPSKPIFDLCPPLVRDQTSSLRYGKSLGGLALPLQNPLACGALILGVLPVAQMIWVATNFQSGRIFLLTAAYEENCCVHDGIRDWLFSGLFPKRSAGWNSVRSICVRSGWEIYFRYECR